jgi:hypothetical protein
MSPGRASAAAQVDEVVSPRRAPGPARLRSAESQPGRLARVIAVLRSGNMIGRVGTLTAIALFVAVFGVVVFQAFLVQGQARLDHLNGQIATERQTSRQLQLQLAQLDSPARIVTAARALGMIEAGDVVYLQPAASDDAAARYTAPATTGTTPVTTATTIPATTTTVSTPTTTGSTTATSVKATRP